MSRNNKRSTAHADELLLDGWLHAVKHSSVYDIRRRIERNEANIVPILIRHFKTTDLDELAGKVAKK